MADVNIIIRAKVLIDGLGGPPIRQGLVSIAGEKIAYVGAAASAPAFPPEAQVIDLPDATLLPGLIDMHCHPTFYYEEPDLATYTDDYDGVSTYPPAMVALLAAGNIRKALLSGMTTLRDTGSVNDIMFDVRRAVKKGLIPGPRLYLSGRLIIPTGGHCHNLAGLSNQADGPHDFRRAVREEVRTGADFIKIANDKQDLTQEELNAAVDEAHRLEKKVCCHTIWHPSQRMAIEAGVDTFEHGTPTPEEIDLAAQKGITWTPTINMSQEYLKWYEQQSKHSDPGIAHTAQQGYASQKQYLEQKHASMEYALKAGLRIVAGTDSFMRDVRFDALPDEIRTLVDYGCSPMQAIQAATSWAAESMGWKDIGTLQPGKAADVIALAGNPLEDIHALDKVTLVISYGNVVKKQP